jgi:outer membrane immunogenic protein
VKQSVLLFCVTCLLAQGLVGAALAQTRIPADEEIAPLEVTLAYSADRTNGVAGGCGCFWLSGGRAEASATFPDGISIVSEVAGQHAANINSTLNSLSLVSYLFGPRYSFRNRSRLLPFAQFLLGGVHGFDALFPSPRASVPDPDAFAFAAGGGLNGNFSRRLAVRVIQADYLRSQLPNAGDNRQNHLRLSAGIVFRFGSAVSNR